MHNISLGYSFQALGLRRDDTFSTTMLDNVIEELMKEMSPCDGKGLLYSEWWG